MQKAKKYDWKDSNLALFGSDTEKQVKKESAESEPMWEGAGSEVGLKIWRIQKFEVTEWPAEDYGEFFNGDSYIILNTYQEEDSEELNHDVHFWIGSQSTQDEYGTAAYKTVELDTFLDDKPVQHREVEGHESAMFKSYFQTFVTLKGGADSGFRHVIPEEYKPRLLKISKEGRTLQRTEVTFKKGSVTSGDVFILDLGLTLIQYNGKDSSGVERHRAAQEVQLIESERGGKPDTLVIDEDQGPDRQFFEHLPDDASTDLDGPDPEPEDLTPQLFRLSDSEGFVEVKSGDITKDDFVSDDVFIFDSKVKGLFVWCGSGASIEERNNGIPYAHNYLMGTDHPCVSVTCLGEGKENCPAYREFEAALAA